MCVVITADFFVRSAVIFNELWDCIHYVDVLE